MFAGQPAAQGLLEQREPFELATAALLIELARSDFSESTAELDAIRHAVAEALRPERGRSGNAAGARPDDAPTARFRCTNSRIG